MAVYNFLLWNIAGQPSALGLVRDIAASHASDVILLVEATGMDRKLLDVEVNRGRPPNLRFAVIADGSGLAMLVKPELAYREDPLARGIRHIQVMFRPLLGDPFTVVLAHLPSRLHKDRASVNGAAIELAQTLRSDGGVLNGRRFIVAGDFNLNPFDDGIAGFSGFNACLYADVIRRLPERTFDKTPRANLFNPMFHILRRSRVSGTYYRSARETTDFYWNQFDQFLLSPDLADRVVFKRTRIVHKCMDRSLVSDNALPSKRHGHSDHLPLVLALDL